MISNPNLVFYVCIAKGSVILGEFSSKEPGIESLAAKCVESTPPYHTMYFQTVRNRSYTFLIAYPLTYFGIFDESMERSETVWLLNRLRYACEDQILRGNIKSLENVDSNCLQSQFDSIYANIMDTAEPDSVVSPRSLEGGVPNPSLDSSKSFRTSMTPLLGKSFNLLKKKKKKKAYPEPKSHGYGDVASPTRERKVDFCGDGVNDVLCGDGKNGLLHGADFHRQKAKQIWRKHVLAVLVFDLFVCSLLFGIWLWVCKGFQCIEA